jgi:uncharacterized damage-inducible protein DinB
MTANDLLIRQLRRQIDSFFEAVHAIPADKLDWQPSPNSRSALDQLQEVATLFSGVADAVRARKLTFTPEMMEEWLTERKKLTDVAEIEKITREGTEKFIEFIQSLSPDDLSDNVEMPWPGEFQVGDLLSYHYWNMAYHEGQIYYIGTLLKQN